MNNIIKILSSLVISIILLGVPFVTGYSIVAFGIYDFRTFICLVVNAVEIISFSLVVYVLLLPNVDK